MICEKTKRECDYYFENIGCVANVKCNLQEMKNIPKHGDLIDRNKASTQIIAEICQFCASAENGNCDGCLVQKCLEAIGRVPTIVEAT